MTFRRSAPAALIAVAVIVIAGSTFISDRLFSGLTASVEKSQFQLMQSILDTALRNAAEDALARADIIAALPVTKQAVAAQGPRAPARRIRRDVRDPEGAARRRPGAVPRAAGAVAAAAARARRGSATISRASGRWSSRSIASTRRATVWRSRATGPAIFGVTPVQDAQGNHVGSVEFGLDFGPMLDGLKAAYGLEFTLFIEEKPLREFAPGVNPAVLSDQNRVGRFIRFHTTNGALMRDLATDADISTVNEPVRYTRDAQGVPYGVLLVPLRDGAGEFARRDRGGARLQRHRAPPPAARWSGRSASPSSPS